MRLPRDVSGAELAKRLEHVGYKVTHQTGSHMRLTLSDPPEHHVTIPAHDGLRIGTLAAILSSVAARLNTSREDLTRRLFG